MEPNLKVLNTRGSLGGQEVAMTIDETSMVYLMDLLTNLYSDPELAVLREYSTNAYDAHVEAGEKRPIEISLPTTNQPFLKIKDYGVGLSVDDLINIYSKYGASTKRGTNEQTGMLGVGGKSALTYTNQFSVLSVKNGVKATVSVSLTNDGTPKMTIVDTKSTSESNGVEVVVPAKQYNQFATKAKEFFQFWQPGTVLIDGRPAERFQGKEVCPNVFMVEDLSEDYIVMGNVAYPTENRIFTSANYTNFGLVCFVPIGKVNFTPSREALHYTKLTNETIEQINKDFTAALTKSIQDDINSSTTHGEALENYIKWHNMLSYALPKGLTYNGEAIPDRFKGNWLVWDTNAYRYSTSHRHELAYGTLQKGVVFVGFEAHQLSPSHKRKVRAWADQQDINARHFIFVKDEPTEQWLQGIHMEKWEDIKVMRLPRNPYSVAQPKRVGPAPYEIWDNANSVTKDEINLTGVILYHSPKDKLSRDAYRALTAVVPTATIVIAGENRWEKLKRDYPTAQQLQTYVNQNYANAKAALTEQDKMLMNLPSSISQLSRNLDESKVDDPDVVDFVKLVKGITPSPTRKAFEQWAGVRRSIGYYTEQIPGKKGTPLDRYLLLNTRDYYGNHRVDGHTYVYLNAAYEAFNQGRI